MVIARYNITDFSCRVKLLKAGCTNVGPRGDHEANVTLNFHQGGMVLALYHFPHEQSVKLIRLSLDVLLECPVGDFHRSLLPVARVEDRKPVISSAPFFLCCVPERSKGSLLKPAYALSAVRRTMRFRWPNEHPFQLNRYRLNHHQCCSSSSHDDSVFL